MTGGTLQTIQKYVRDILGPLFLLCFLFPLCLAIWYTHVALDGSIEKLFSVLAHRGFFSSIYTICHPYLLGTLASWKIFALFVTTCLILIKWLPGKRFYDGPLSPDGTLSVSKANGFFVFLSMLGLYIFASCILKLFPPTVFYDHFAGLLGTLNAFSVCFWLFSYAKERWAKKLSWHIDIFTICRCAMIGWGLIILSFAFTQRASYGLTDAMVLSVALQWTFIAKFFLWEIEYLRAMDITYDKTGFCLCWGCIVWIPAIYTSPSLYLVQHPHRLGLALSFVLFICGSGCILLNFLVDRQRHYVRNTNGECLVWRKKPDLIFANYRTEWGEEKQNVLLVSGWWGISRHFHYIPELLGALFWSILTLFNHFLPYFYLCFLTLLLIDRAYRHEKRCAMKYGKDWEKYCEKVPFRIIPFIY